MRKFIPYGRQDINEEDIQQVTKVLQGDFITQGPTITALEEALCNYTGSRYAVAFNSATSALHGAYFACGLSENDEIITSPNTFVATSNAALYLGAKPVFADINGETGNILPETIASKITSKTKIIVPVDFSGQPCDLKEIKTIANNCDAYVVEDASHAVGAEYLTKKTGGNDYADITIFSFHPVKIITSGEGGVAFTNNEDFYNEMIKFRSHGITKKDFINKPSGPWYYEMHDLGFNYRMTDIQAALGLSQLKRLDSFISKRHEIARKYDLAFSNETNFKPIIQKENRKSAYHLYPILLKPELKAKKKKIFEQLHENGIGVQCHYIPVNHQPYYNALGYKTSDTPNALDFYEREISLPMYTTLTEEEQNKVIKTVIDVCATS